MLGSWKFISGSLFLLMYIVPKPYNVIVSHGLSVLALESAS